VGTGAAADEEPDEPLDPEPLDPEPLDPEPLDPEPLTDEPLVAEPVVPEPLVVEPVAPVFGEADSVVAVAAAAAAGEAFALAGGADVEVVEACDVAGAALAGRLPAPSAGSCPVTRYTKIATQTATKRESVIAATRRRMPRVRCLRAPSRSRARRRASSGDIEAGVKLGSGMNRSIPPGRESEVGPS
jgi:hypothetical protein